MTLRYCPRCGFDLETQTGGVVYAFRQTVIIDQPGGKTLAWINRGDKMLAYADMLISGKVSYLRVSTNYLGRIVEGWVRQDRVEPYIEPTPETDPTNPDNAQRVFDLSAPEIYIPGDREIEQAIQAGKAAQYIDLARAGYAGIKYNLCGPFCAAALAGRDVVEACAEWGASSKVAAGILRNDHTTGIGDLSGMLDVLGAPYRKSEYSIKYYPSPQRLTMTTQAIFGVSINNRGEITPKGYIRHWVVLTDVLPAGADGWVRVYNPFNNREEVYLYSEFEQCFFPGTILIRG